MDDFEKNRRKTLEIYCEFERENIKYAQTSAKKVEIILVIVGTFKRKIELGWGGGGVEK